MSWIAWERCADEIVEPGAMFMAIVSGGYDSFAVAGVIDMMDEPEVGAFVALEAWFNNGRYDPVNKRQIGSKEEAAEAFETATDDEICYEIGEFPTFDEAAAAVEAFIEDYE